MEFSGLAEGKNIMKPIESLIRDNVKNLKPCVHGAEVLGAAEESGLLPRTFWISAQA